MGFLWVIMTGFSFFHGVASPFHSFVTTVQDRTLTAISTQSYVSLQAVPKHRRSFKLLFQAPRTRRRAHAYVALTTVALGILRMSTSGWMAMAQEVLSGVAGADSGTETPTFAVMEPQEAHAAANTGTFSN